MRRARGRAGGFVCIVGRVGKKKLKKKVSCFQNILSYGTTSGTFKGVKVKILTGRFGSVCDEGLCLCTSSVV